MRARKDEMTEPCRNWCELAPDVLASAQVPHERVSRKLTCVRSRHDDGACEADGWRWLNGQIWRIADER